MLHVAGYPESIEMRFESRSGNRREMGELGEGVLLKRGLNCRWTALLLQLKELLLLLL